MKKLNPGNWLRVEYTGKNNCDKLKKVCKYFEECGYTRPWDNSFFDNRRDNFRFAILYIDRHPCGLEFHCQLISSNCTDSEIYEDYNEELEVFIDFDFNTYYDVE